MAKRSSNKWDNPRDKRHTAYVYDSTEKVFRNSKCIKRNSKMNCLEWRHHTLDPNSPEDAKFIEDVMILMSEGEL